MVRVGGKELSGDVSVKTNDNHASERVPYRTRLIEAMVPNMPIVNVTTHGDMTKPGSFRADDLRYINSAKAQTKMVRVLAKTPADIDLHFLNLPDAIKNTEHYFNSAHRVGFVLPQRFKCLYSIDIPSDPRVVSVVLVENEGIARLPLTPWLIAHRISHAYAINFNQQTVSKKTYNDFDETISKLAKLYKCGNHPILSAELSPVFGTSRSSRRNRITRLGEWYHETFSQYCVNGRIHFKPAIRRGFNHKVAGRSDEYVLDKGTLLREVNRELTELAERLMLNYDGIVRSGPGSLIVL